MIADTDGEGLSSECNSNAEDSQPGNSSRNVEQMFLVLFSIHLMMRIDFFCLLTSYFFPQTASFWRKEALQGGQMLLRHWRRSELLK